MNHWHMATGDASGALQSHGLYLARPVISVDMAAQPVPPLVAECDNPLCFAAQFSSAAMGQLVMLVHNATAPKVQLPRDMRRG